ncbi:MAG: ribonuclease Z [Oscillospiraceae bacterium]|nr:ribonuclease Z [Oscillospiraceae bacterium]
MTIVICADKNGGILFNNRRQSRDSKLIEDLIAFAKNRKILSAPYSEKLFATTDADLCFCPDYLDKAGEKDVCFVEKEDPAPYLSAADELIVYRWNKVYPADRFFVPEDFGFRLANKTDFPGSSHDNIDREVYVK